MLLNVFHAAKQFLIAQIVPKIQQIKLLHALSVNQILIHKLSISMGLYSWMNVLAAVPSYLIVNNVSIIPIHHFHHAMFANKDSF